MDRNILVNYWEKNSELLAIQAIKKLYDNDETLDKSRSSTIMYAIELIYDYESRYAKMAEPERIKLIEKEYIGEKNFFTINAIDMKPIIDMYKKIQEDSELRYLRTWEAKVEERRVFLESITYDDKNYSKIDDMLLQSSKILEQKKVIMDLVKKEAKSKIKGGQKLSLLAQNKLTKIVEDENKKRI
jgi:hypothetical protein